MKGFIGVALAMAALATGVAFAHTHAFSQARLSFDRAQPDPADPAAAIFGGTVAHSEPKCERAREVHVYRVDPGNDVRLAKTFSRPNGDWRASGPAPASGAEVYALIEAKVMNRPGHTHTCKARVGRERTFPFP